MKRSGVLAVLDRCKAAAFVFLSAAASSGIRRNDATQRPPARMRTRGHQKEREKGNEGTGGGIGDDISVGRRSKPVGCVTPKGAEGREGEAPHLPPPPQMMHQKEVRGVTVAFYDGSESSSMWIRDSDLSCSSTALMNAVYIVAYKESCHV